MIFSLSICGVKAIIDLGRLGIFFMQSFNLLKGPPDNQQQVQDEMLAQ
jgi:hypothetical protein